MRGGLVVFGIIILVLAYVSSSALSAQQQSQLQLAGGACNSVFGTIGSALSGTIAQDCQQVNTINTLLSLVPIAYIIGGIIFLVGLVSPGRHRERLQPTNTAKETSVAKDDEPLKTLKMRYAKGEITKKEYNDMKKELE